MTSNHWWCAAFEALFPTRLVHVYDLTFASQVGGRNEWFGDNMIHASLTLDMNEVPPGLGMLEIESEESLSLSLALRNLDSNLILEQVAENPTMEPHYLAAGWRAIGAVMLVPWMGLKAALEGGRLPLEASRFQVKQQVPHTRYVELGTHLKGIEERWSQHFVEGCATALWKPAACIWSDAARYEAQAKQRKLDRKAKAKARRRGRMDAFNTAEVDLVSGREDNDPKLMTGK